MLRAGCCQEVAKYGYVQEPWPKDFYPEVGEPQKRFKQKKGCEAGETGGRRIRWPSAVVPREWCLLGWVL